MSSGCGPCGHKKPSSNGCPPVPGSSCKQCPQPELPPYQENCPPKWCPPVCVDDLSGAEVGVKYKEAVVKITAQFNFTTATEDRILQARTPPENLEIVYVKGNGFFTNKHVIVCPASLVLAPPNHTLTYNRWPSTSNSIINLLALQYTPLQPALPALPVPVPVGPFKVFNKDVMTRANRFLVDVYNVNGSEHSYTYEADLIGVSGVGDVALLWIDPQRPWNATVPCIKECHPHFRFGCSRKVKDGEKAFLIGDSAARKGNGGQFYYNPPVTAVQLEAGIATQVAGPAPNIGGVAGLSNVFSNGNVVPQGNRGLFVIPTHVTKHRHVDHCGYAQQELIAVCACVFAENVGLPIIDRFGHVIGMQTMSSTGSVQRFDGSGSRFDSFTGGVGAPGPLVNGNVVALAGKNGTVPYNGDGIVAGPSQFFLLHIIKTLLCPRDSCNQSFVELVVDILGNYYRYTQAYLGVAWEVFDGSMYLDFRSNSGNFGVFKPFFDANINSIKEVVGLRVVGLADDPLAVPNRSADDIHEPNFNYTISPTGVYIDSPNNNPLNGTDVVLNKVRRNDVITHAEECPLGDLNLQIPLSLVLFRKAPGETVKLCVRSTSGSAPDGYESSFDAILGGGLPTRGGYNTLFTLKAQSQKMVRFYDYPWYKYASFPWNQLQQFTAFMDQFPNETGNTVSNSNLLGIAVHATIPVI